MRDEDPDNRIGDLIRYGIVVSRDLMAGTINCTIGDIETGPIPWLHAAAGDTGSWSPPGLQEQVLILCPEGDPKGAIAMRGVSYNARPRVGNSERELFKFADNAVIAYDPVAHKLEAVLPDGATVSIIAPGGVTIDADVRITGNLQVDGDMHADGDVKADTVSLKTHKHSGVQSGAAQTGAPV